MHPDRWLLSTARAPRCLQADQGEGCAVAAHVHAENCTRRLAKGGTGRACCRASGARRPKGESAVRPVSPAVLSIPPSHLYLNLLLLGEQPIIGFISCKQNIVHLNTIAAPVPFVFSLNECGLCLFQALGKRVALQTDLYATVHTGLAACDPAEYVAQLMVLARTQARVIRARREVRTYPTLPEATTAAPLPAHRVLKLTSVCVHLTGGAYCGFRWRLPV